MLNKLKDFIDAYKKINSDRIDAKACIVGLKRSIKEFKNISTKCHNIENDLKDVYHYCPNDQRKDFIQCTLDFFHYGYNIIKKPDGGRTYFGGYNLGWTKRIDNLVKYLSTCYDECNTLYNERNYNGVIQRYDSVNKYIDNELFDEKYSYEHIKEEYNKLYNENK